MEETVVVELMAREETVKTTTEAQRELVCHRPAECRADPHEPVASLDDIKRELGVSLR
jgi:hypothetical protein